MVPYLALALVTASTVVFCVSCQVSIPTCCQPENHGNFRCPQNKNIKYEGNPPTSIPPDIATRLLLSKHRNNSKWVVNDLNCKSGSPIFRSFSTLTEDFEFLPDGYLLLEDKQNETLKSGALGPKKRGSYFHVSQYCINKISNEDVEVKVCEAECTSSKPCLELCCPIGRVFSLEGLESKCLKQNWHPSLYRSVGDKKSALSPKELRDVQPRYFLRPPPSWRFSKCDGNEALLYINSHKVINSLNEYIMGVVQYLMFRVDAEGNPRYWDPVYRKWKSIPRDQHCITGIFGTEYLDEEPMLVFLCARQLAKAEPQEKQVSEYYGPLCLFASVFALVTVIAYALLIERQNIHGWTTMSHSTAVFFLFIFLGTAHITKEYVSFHKTIGCVFIATAAHYFFIAAFTWLLILSLDLWLTFRTVSAPTGRGGRRLKRFLFYSVAGWGLPALVVSISWILEAEFKDDVNSPVRVPYYGDFFCYVGRPFLWEFVYAPVSILFCVNLVLFIWTSVTLYWFQQSTKIAMTNINQDRQTFGLFVKLFLVCGVIWITELLSFTISGAHVTWYIQIFDSLNILQPVAIFFIFIFKWEIINGLHEKFIPLRPIIFPARFILLKFRNHGMNRPEAAAVHYSKTNETHVSRISNP